MKILMIANFITLPNEGGNSRFIYILNKLDYKNNEVELITSNFRHSSKSFRGTLNQKDKYKITLLPELGYKKNVSIKRLLSHYFFSKNLKKYLNNIKIKPDVIYCSIPSLSCAFEALKYSKKNKIKFIIDVQDLWPEAFKMALDIPMVSNIVFFPMMSLANYIYKNCENVVAVSETYVNRVKKNSKVFKRGFSVYLGTDLSYFDRCKKEKRKILCDNIIRIVYIGTLGTSYDIKTIIDSIKLLNNKGYNNIKFIIIGDGPLKQSFEKYARESKINYKFTGKLNYDDMVANLCNCDIAVNPIVGKSVASIINKVGDYAAAGLPVINTQNSEEYRKILSDKEAGFNCINGDSNDIAKKIEILLNDSKLRVKMGNNNRKLAEERFDRNRTYETIINLIENKDK